MIQISPETLPVTIPETLPVTIEENAEPEFRAIRMLKAPQ